MTFQPHTGKPVNRLEGEMKVTGAAQYSGDYDVPNLLYGYVVNSTITKGKIKHINTKEVSDMEGVVKVYTHENRPKLAWFDIQYADMDAPPGSVFKYLSDEKILFNGQPVALVIAESFEMARYAASMLKVSYQQEEFETCLEENITTGRNAKKGMATLLKPPPPKPAGDFQKAFNESPAKVSSTFRHGTEHHNPLELFATTVVYEGKDKLTIYDKTQGTNNTQIYVANVFGLKFKNVRVLAPFVGGGFGSALRPQQQLFFSVMAALDLKRNVRVTLDRKQMFSFGHRPQSLQEIKFSAGDDGALTGINHKAFGETSRFEDYTENVVGWSHMLYPAPNTLLEYQIVPLDLYTPLDMRTPGGCTGMHAIEVTMDELAYELKMDPLELRLKNYTEINLSEKKPFTSKELKQCYLKAAERFGWSKRIPEPGSMRRGNKLVGYGMATGIWDAMQMPARVEVVYNKDGKLVVSSAVTDIGVGTYTVITQIVADELGLSMNDVEFNYGDSKKPLSFVQGGSFTTASVGSAMVMALGKLKKKFYKKALKRKNSPLKGVDKKQINFHDGKIGIMSDPSSHISLKQIVEEDNKGKPIKVTKTGYPHAVKLRKYSRAAHSAAFVEVEIDEALKTINVTRAVTAVAAGKIINPKTAKSQILGGMIWGVSKTLQEETILDHKLGKYMNTNLAEYHIPVHADIHDFDVIFADEPDGLINELGMKGVGEIGLVAIPPAITNAIFHATGKRLRELPIHFDDLL